VSLDPLPRPIAGLEDAFGLRTRLLRQLQSSLMEIFRRSDYDEVIPPLLERPESMNCGAGRFLADQTMIFTDPAGAGLLAIRPDITPQIARIAATRLRNEAVLRLCYSGQVLLARPDSLSGSRQQWQTGVELLGQAGKEADIEVMHLAVLCLQAAGFSRPVLQVGHTGLIQALVADSGIPIDTWADVLRRRSPDDMHAILPRASLPDAHKKALMDIASGLSNRVWLEQEHSALPASFRDACQQFLDLVWHVQQRLENEVDVQLEVAVMPRFFYHSGIVFSAFSEGAPSALLHGGRYDDLLRQHGRDMPATGFSCDLWAWLDAGAMRLEA